VTSRTKAAPHAAEAMLENLRKAGLKRTAQREAIARQLATDCTHPTAQELFERLRPAFPTMSFATVYNTLDALTSAGLARTLRLGGAARFDPNVDPHHHAVCDACGAIVDLPVASIDATTAERSQLRASADGFAVRTVEHVYRGLCAACQKAQGSEAEPA